MSEGKMYRGEFSHARGWEVFVNDRPLMFPQQLIVPQRAAHFEWGKCGPGTRALAMALLFDAGGDARIATHFAPEFEFHTLRHLPLFWQITQRDLLETYAEFQAAPDPEPDVIVRIAY